MAKILMVDDDKEFLASAKDLLEGKGHEVSLAYNAKDAESAALSGDFDIVFLDVMMDEADDGIALAHNLKKKGVKAPLIMLSNVSKVSGYEYGKCDEALPCSGFLEKPIRPEELGAKVDSLLNKDKE